MSNLHEIRTVKCANCGKLRQETNHWFLVSVERGRFRCVPLSDRMTGRSPGRTSWQLRRGLRRNQEPACGQHCVQKIFERYLYQTMARRQRSGSRINYETSRLPPAAREM